MPISFDLDHLDLIDRRRALHATLFEWCLTQSEFFMGKGQHEPASRWLIVAARFADSFGCGAFVSPRMESLAHTLAMQLPIPAHRRPERRLRRRWLHVLSRVYSTGGHTTMLRRWIEADDSGDEHHLVLTFTEKLEIQAVRDCIERTGGKVFTLGNIPSILQKANRLRELAWQESDQVVMHSHMWDVVPTIAFGVVGGPPVLLLNHADHTFWVGASVADLLVNLRLSGQNSQSRAGALTAISCFAYLCRRRPRQIAYYKTARKCVPSLAFPFPQSSS